MGKYTGQNIFALFVQPSSLDAVLKKTLVEMLTKKDGTEWKYIRVLKGPHLEVVSPSSGGDCKASMIVDFVINVPKVKSFEFNVAIDADVVARIDGPGLLNVNYFCPPTTTTSDQRLSVIPLPFRLHSEGRRNDVSRPRCGSSGHRVRGSSHDAQSGRSRPRSSWDP